MPKALIIDFGGVLSTPFEDAARAFCTQQGLEPSALMTALRQHADLVADLERGNTSQQEFQDTIGLALRIFPDDLIERMTRTMELRANVMDAVKRVRKTAKVAVLTNSLGSDPYDLYERFNLKVDALVASDQHRMRKPDPEIYVLAAKAIGAEPSDCVYVDDSKKFLEPASALKMTTVEATSPEVTIKALADLF